MFIAAIARPKVLAPLGAKPDSGQFGKSPKAIALLRSAKQRETRRGYKHLAPLGRSDNESSVVLPK
jgi:hypothetical protein